MNSVKHFGSIRVTAKPPPMVVVVGWSWEAAVMAAEGVEMMGAAAEAAMTGWEMVAVAMGLIAMNDHRVAPTE